MISRRQLLIGAAGLAGVAVVARSAVVGQGVKASGPFPVAHSEAEWRSLLTPHQFAVLREHATEPPYSSPLLNEHRTGTFHCAGCANPLFASTTKYDSGTGWPSFWASLEGALGTSFDTSLFVERIEVHCANCGGHLGHVFDDGPEPTGQRYCMNGVALTFTPV